VILPPGGCQALGEARTDWIVDIDHDDRDGRGRTPRGDNGRVARSHGYFDFEVVEVSGEFLHSGDTSVTHLQEFNNEVLALNPAEPTQGLLERRYVWVVGIEGGTSCVEHADSSYLRRWLRPGGERCKKTQSENNREPDPPHGHLDEGWLAGSLAERREAHQHGARGRVGVGRRGVSAAERSRRKN
jgi:hypothetical protein